MNFWMQNYAIYCISEFALFDVHFKAIIETSMTIFNGISVQNKAEMISAKYLAHFKNITSCTYFAQIIC